MALSSNFKILFSTSLILLSSTAVSRAQFEVTVNGRVDFVAQDQEQASYILGSTNPSNASAVSAFGSPKAIFSSKSAMTQAFLAAGGTFEEQKRIVTGDLAFSTTGRIDFMTNRQHEGLDYGGLTRLNFDGEAANIADVDAHIYLSGTLGQLQFGTDIEAYQKTRDQDHLSAGPLSPGNKAAFGGTLKKPPFKESRLVATAPSVVGLELKGQVDADGNWASSAAYRSSFGETDVELAASADSETTLAGYAKASFGDFSAVGFAVRDKDEERLAGAGLGLYMGQLHMSLEGSVAKSDELLGLSVEGIAGVTSADINKVDSYFERDIVVGAAYEMAPGLSIVGSIAVHDHELVGDRQAAAARLRLTF